MVVVVVVVVMGLLFLFEQERRIQLQHPLDIKGFDSCATRHVTGKKVGHRYV
jgi:hypothetical protein